MDPNTCLKDILRYAKEIDDLAGITNDLEKVADKAEMLASLVLSLNDWIKGGGFLPDQWGPKK